MICLSREIDRPLLLISSSPVTSKTEEQIQSFRLAVKSISNNNTDSRKDRERVTGRAVRRRIAGRNLRMARCSTAYAVSSPRSD